MQVGLRHFSPETIDWLIGAAKRQDMTRSELARELCEREGWHNPLGKPCLGSARKCLRKLAAKLGIELPAPRSISGYSTILDLTPVPDIELAASLADIGPVSLTIASTAEAKLQYQALMNSYHPEGWTRPPGGQIRYLATIPRHGVIGGIGFVDASWHQAARDEWIGWSQEARVNNIGLILNNHRFLILPGLRVRNLASHILGAACRRVADDWNEVYGRRPLLAYTYVGPRWRGTCYGAAGWKRCERQTSGRTGTIRSIWMRPLDEDWKRRLYKVPRRRLGNMPERRFAEDADWADFEFGRCSHPDSRIRVRIVAMGRVWGERPNASIPNLFPDSASRQAAYRLLSNPRVKIEHVLESHCEATVARCRLERVVLAVQDTTALNCGTLDNIGGGAQELLAHVGLAVAESGRPLGLYSLEADFRRKPGKDSERWQRCMERAGELAEACPDTRVVSVCDREDDFWDLTTIAEASQADLLVQASRSTRRRVSLPGGRSECLWEHVKTLPVLARRKLKIAARGGRDARRARTATIEFRAARLDIVPPEGKGTQPRRMLVVSARERTASGRKPLHWLLMATVGEADAKTAQRLVGWYQKRWVSEEYFRALKSGTHIKNRKLNEADELRKCLAFDAITAWRVGELEWQARNNPDEPARNVDS